MKKVSVLTPESGVLLIFESNCSKKIESDKKIKLSETAH